jgi:hypothetical protein
MAAVLRAGFGQVEITPPLGLDIAGSLSPTASRGTRDPLFARALVLDDGRTRAALVSLDLLAIERPEALLQEAAAARW